VESETGAVAMLHSGLVVGLGISGLGRSYRWLSMNKASPRFHWFLTVFIFSWLYSISTMLLRA
jgi:hypothetical protein